MWKSKWCFRNIFNDTTRINTECDGPQNPPKFSTKSPRFIRTLSFSLFTKLCRRVRNAQPYQHLMPKHSNNYVKTKFVNHQPQRRSWSEIAGVASWGRFPFEKACHVPWWHHLLSPQNTPGLLLPNTTDISWLKWQFVVEVQAGDPRFCFLWGFEILVSKDSSEQFWKW